MPKLLYLLRTSDCSNNPLLSQFNRILRSGLSAILNAECEHQRHSMAASLIACRKRWTRDQECWDTGTFCLLGISCINSLPPAVHSSWLYQSTWRPVSFGHRRSVVSNVRVYQTSHRAATHRESVGRTDTVPSLYCWPCRAGRGTWASCASVCGRHTNLWLQSIVVSWSATDPYVGLHWRRSLLDVVEPSTVERRQNRVPVVFGSLATESAPDFVF